MNERTDIIEQLLRYRRNELSGKEKSAIEKRLAKDPDLREMLALLGQLDRRGAELSEADIVKAAGALADQIYQDYFRRGKQRRVPVGVTVFDSKLLPLPAGVRPAAVDTRQLRYRIGESEVILMLYPVAPDSYEIMGQIGETLAEGTVSLSLSRRGFEAETTTDEFGLFRFERVPLGSYRLTLSEQSRAVGLIHVTI